MCFFCAMTSPADPLAGFDQHLGSAGSAGSGSGGGTIGAPFTWDQIAGQLTSGYWVYNSEASRFFFLDGSRTLTYDIANLSVSAQQVALAAMEAWSEVSNITFVAVATPVTNFVVESSDAAAGTGTGYLLNATMTSVNGDFDFSNDVDGYRVALVAGQTYMIAATSGSTDVVLQLLDAFGNEVGFSDYTYTGDGEYITFTASSTANYFINVSEFYGDTGSYTMTVELVTADITFNDMDAGGAYAFSDLSGYEIMRSFINIHDSWSALNLNGYMLQTYIHELGHALGLGHAGNYNGSASWPANALYDNDSWAASVMSYFSQTENPNFEGSLAYLATVMPADIIAIQTLYGFYGTTNAGNTVYGFNSNMGGYLQDLLNMWTGALAANASVYAGQPIAFTIFDSTGIDTINFSNFTMDQTINLNELTYSSVGGLDLNLIIARNVVIENATGGSGNDTLIGNAANNILAGGLGADHLYGGAGNDALGGGGGADMMYGGTGNDIFYIDSASDQAIELVGEGTADNIYTTLQTFSLVGLDHIEFLTGISPTVGHTLIGNNNNNIIAGNNRADVIAGGIGNDTLYGLNGDDTLGGGSGNDFMFGGAGNDLYYVDSLQDRVIENSGEGTADTIAVAVGSYSMAAVANVENLVGLLTTGQLLVGNTLGNRITGNTGNDVLMGGLGNDTLVGGAGADRFVFNTGLGAGNVDAIQDFSVVDDTIGLDDLIFTTLTGGTLLAGHFAIGVAATAAWHRIIYNQGTGQLFYDADGAGGNAQILFATVAPGLAMTNADFLVI